MESLRVVAPLISLLLSFPPASPDTTFSGGGGGGAFSFAAAVRRSAEA